MTLTETPVPTITPTLSQIEQIVHEYLTAIEQDNWQAAYDLLCPEIQAVILPLPDRSNRVQFILPRTTDGWVTGIREARLEEGSLKVCGVGAEHGDLRYLLQIGDVGPLNMNP